MFSYSAIYLNIYLLLIILSSLLFNIYNRWISAPLVEIRNSLKKLQLGEENEHINYPIKADDEISGLIREYNTLIDELAHST